MATEMRPCECGHSVEEHGNDPAYPLATECSECSCCMYEPDMYEDPKGEGDG